MVAMSGPELESLKRSIDLVEYARSMGYIDRPRDSLPGIVVLEHERLGDRIAVARCARGGIYARVPDYGPRQSAESENLARIRLRDAIMRSSDTGSIVELVRSRERMAGRPEPDLQRVCEHLTAWQETSRGLRQGAHRKDLGRRMGDWTPSPVSPDAATASEVEQRLERWRAAQRSIDRRLGLQADRPSPSVGVSLSPRSHEWSNGQFRLAITREGAVIRQTLASGEIGWRLNPDGTMARSGDHKGPWVSLSADQADRARKQFPYEVQQRLDRWQQVELAAQARLAERSIKPEAALRRYDWSPTPSSAPIAASAKIGVRRERGGTDQGRGR
jgi:hypothetical protein